MRLAALSVRRVFHRRCLSTKPQDFGEFVAQIEQSKLQGDDATDLYAGFIRKCRDEKSFAQGVRVHEHIDKQQSTSRYIYNLLIEMFGKCGRLDYARKVFDDLPTKNVYSWNIMVGAYVQNGEFDQAWFLFRKMQLEGAGANHVTFINILNVCISTSAVLPGKRVYHLVAGSGLEMNTAIATAFLNMFGKCGEVDAAREVFNTMVGPVRDTITWNAMITAYSENGFGDEALFLMKLLLLEGTKLDVVSFVSLVSASTMALDLAHGRMVHHLAVEAGCNHDLILGNCLVNMYAKCGSVEDARRFFDGMRVRDRVTWNTMIAAYAQGETPEEGLEVFREMDIEPDRITFVALFDACANMESLEEGKRIHELLIAKNMVNDLIVQTALVNMYVKCGDLAAAKEHFKAMAFKDVVCWNAFLGAHTLKGHGKEALTVLSTMDLMGVKLTRITLTSALEACANSGLLAEGRRVYHRVVGAGLSRDLVTCSAVINMFGKCRSLDEARAVFEDMPEKNVVSWTTLIAVSVDNDCGNHAIELFQRMDQEGVKQNAYTYGRVMDACANNRDVVRGLGFYSRARETGLDSDTFVGTSIINMLGKCNQLREARSAFDRLSQRDVISWNVLIGGCIQNEEYEKALAIYREMVLSGTPGDSITYMCVLDACASLGSVSDGKVVHAQIVEAGYESVDVVVSTLVNMYGKCGFPEDARYLFENKMEAKSVVAWNSAITAYGQNGDSKQAIQVFRGMELEGVKADEISFITVLDACGQLGSLTAGRGYHGRAVEAGYGEATVLCNTLLNMYGRCGSLEDAKDVFLKMGDRKNAVSWNTMIFTTAKKGTLNGTLEMFREMDLEGVKPNHISFVSLLFACSHAGMLEQGREQFQYMTGDHGLVATPSHYGCFIDLLGRAGRLADAEELIQNMPIAAGSIEWMSLLSVCETVEQGSRAMKRIDESWSAPFTKMSNILRLQNA